MRLFRLVVIILVISVLISEKRIVVSYVNQFIDQPFEISAAENLIDRASYEQMLVRNPETGKIPENIRTRELRFTSGIQSRASIGEGNEFRSTATNTFTLAGPSNVGGRTRGVALDVLNENIILAGGVSGGMWKSTDQGTSWRRTSDPTIRNSINCLTQDTRAGKEHFWYFGTGELEGNSARSLVEPYRGTGIYRSSDRGESWQLIQSTVDGSTPDSFGSQFQYISDIEVNKKNTLQDEILVAAFGGILRSLDGGETWETAVGLKLFDLPEGTDINDINSSFYTSLAQNGQGNFIATLSGASAVGNMTAPNAGFYFSNNGENWIDVTPPGLPDSHERTVVGFNGTGDEVYFLTQGEFDAYLFKLSIANSSDDQFSGTWTNLSDNIPAFGGDNGDFSSQGGYNMLVRVHPEDDQVVFIGGTNLYRSTDGFLSDNNTKWIGGYSPDNDASRYENHHPDQHELIFSPSDPDQVISANDGGIRLSFGIRDDSVNWTSRNTGYLTSQFYTIAQRKDEATSEMIGGMQDNGSYLRISLGESPTWNRILGGDGAYCDITANGDFVYVSFQNAQIYRLKISSNSTLEDFARVDPTGGGGDGEDYLFVNPYALDPWNANKMYLTGADVLWRNGNLAQIPSGSQETTSVNWSEIDGTRVGSGLYTALEVARSEDVLYAGVLGESPFIVKVINVSDELADSVTVVSSDDFPVGGHIVSIAVNPEDADHLVVVFSNYGVPSVFESIDGGINFSDVSFNLEENPDGSGDGPSVRWVEVIPLTSGIMYYVGTSTGLYSLERNFTSDDMWFQEGEDVIGNAVITMIDYRDIDGRLIIASHGNGTFQSILEGNRPFLNQPVLSDDLVLEQNYPNPFSDRTVIEYSLPEDGVASIELFDDSGRLIRNLLNGTQFRGENRIFWDGTNSSGHQVKRGTYYYRLTFAGKQSTKRILFLP